MPIVKYNELKHEAMYKGDVRHTTRANVIGPAQGWEQHQLRVIRIGPHGFSPHHQHDWEHVNYVIKGKGTLTITDETFELSPGDFAFVPPNTMHQFRNAGDENLEFICIVPIRGAN